MVFQLSPYSNFEEVTRVQYPAKIVPVNNKWSHAIFSRQYFLGGWLSYVDSLATKVYILTLSDFLYGLFFILKPNS